MKLLITTIAAVLLVGCGESQQSAPAPEVKPVEPVAEAAQPEPPTAKARDISIHEAAEEGNISAVKQHLAAGADVNAKNVEGGTPLHIATILGHTEVAELLIAESADVNAKDVEGGTPLHIAAWLSQKGIAELLIAKDADVNAKIEAGKLKGRTPLDLAIKYKQTELADLLRKHGGKTGEKLKAAEPVAEAASPEPPTAKAPAISIHDAAEKGDIEAVKQYLAAGTDVKAMDKRGRTPLHFAAKRGQKELVELLIANGADVNARRSKYGGGYTPLHYAARHMEIAALLIANGADVNVKMDGKTILDSAKYRNPKFADLLRKHGGKYGSIHTATAGGDTEAVKEFLAAGADVNAKDVIRGTPLDYAVALKRIEIADLLRKHGGKTGEELK